MKSTSASAAVGGFNPWRKIGEWLRNVPLTDPVDRRNAPMMQVLLIMLGSFPPAMWLYRIFAVDVPWRPGETVSFLLSMTISALALASIVLIRRGRFQWAIRQLLVVIALAMMLAYVSTGMEANRFEQPIQAVWLIVAGLMIGRRALWLMYGWTALAFALGTAIDIRRLPEDAAILAPAGHGLIVALIFLFIAVVVDRSVSALRESLQAAQRRGDELTISNARLHEEIAQREQAQDRLIHAQKVETVGRLASGLAHDFNHLLALITGYAERGRSAHDELDRNKALDGIESAARRATAVSQKLLDFSRHDVTMAETFDPSAMLREVQPVLRQLFDPAIEIVMDLPDACRTVRFDHAHLELAILNIAANANQAMIDGGRFQVRLRDQGDAIAIELGDTGVGMSEDILAHIFEAFYTTKPRGQGTGLGLSVARDIVEAGGGSITADSVPGKGSTFRIILPVA
jgi:signal transduction histidine kinase